MSVLYIRDKDGSFTPVPALQGEDGGYYVPHVDADGNLSWTASEADMPSIASVNIKGKDGENGKSGVHVDNEEPTDPSVNVWIDPDGEADGEITEPYVLPVASAYTLGGVKVGEGLTMDGDVLSMEPDGEYELIEEFTLTEDTAVTRTQEPNGTAYGFVALLIKFATNNVNTNKSNIYFAFDGSTVWNPIYLEALTNNTNGSPYTAQIEIYKDRGDYVCDKLSYGYNLYPRAAQKTPRLGVGDKIITGFISEGALSAGTTVTIKGVRANV